LWIFTFAPQVDKINLSSSLDPDIVLRSIFSNFVLVDLLFVVNFFNSENHESARNPLSELVFGLLGHFSQNGFSQSPVILLDLRSYNNLILVNLMALRC